MTRLSKLLLDRCNRFHLVVWTSLLPDAGPMSQWLDRYSRTWQRLDKSLQRRGVEPGVYWERVTPAMKRRVRTTPHALLVGVLVAATAFMSGAAAANALVDSAIKFAIGLWTAVSLAWDTVSVGRAPGSWLLAIARTLFGEKAYRKLYLPIISDMRYAMWEARTAGRGWQARFERLRGTWTFANAAGLDRFWKVIERLIDVFRGAGPAA